MTPSAKLALQVETRRFTNSSKLDRSRDLPKHLEHTPATANLVADAHTTSTPVLLQPLPTSARHLQTTTRKMKKGASETRNQRMQRKCACNGDLLSPALTLVENLYLQPAARHRTEDTLAERSKAVAQGAIPKGRGFEPHRCHFASYFLTPFHIMTARQDVSPSHQKRGHRLSISNVENNVPCVPNLDWAGTTPKAHAASHSAFKKRMDQQYSLRGSNPRPMAHKTIALTTELREPLAPSRHRNTHHVNGLLQNLQLLACQPRSWQTTSQPEQNCSVAGVALETCLKALCHPACLRSIHPAASKPTEPS